jgi:hypothetical protein
VKTDWAALSDALWDRCRGQCERCDRPLLGTWERHHRRLKGQGGLDELDNLLALHPRCHNQHPYSVHNNPNNSRREGFLVSAYCDPAVMPLFLHRRRWVLLGDGYSDLTGDAA